MSRLDHPGIVPIFDQGALPDGRLYYTMKYVDGLTLGSLIDRGTPRERLLSILAETAEIVDFAHEHGVIHRDLKPSNVMVDGAGSVFVLDWGVARVLASNPETEGERAPERRGATSAGTILGTPEYMPPEQARGECAAIDRRSDVFALGAILCRLLTGRPPAGASDGARLQENGARRIPRELEAICLKSLRRCPDDRYSSAAEFGADLRMYLRGDVVSAYPAGLSYRLRKRLRRSRTLGAVAIATLAVASIFGAWAKERAGRRAREAEQVVFLRAAADRQSELRDLLSLWSTVMIAKQEWYQAHKDPRKTRAKIEAALAGLDDFLKRCPDHPQARYVRARGRWTLDDLEGATADLEAAIRAEPEFAPGWSLLGRVKVERYRRAFWSEVVHKDRFNRALPLLAEATEAFERARVAPAGRGSISEWGLERMEEEGVAETIARALSLAYLEKDPERGRRLIKEAYAAAPSEDYCNLLGFWSGRPEEKIHWQTEAIRLRPHYPTAYVDRGLAKLEAGDAKGAIEDYTKALEINPSFAPAFAGRGHARESLRDWSGVVHDVTEALRLDSHDAGSYGCRAYARWWLGEFQGAVDDLSEAIVRNPQEPMLYYYRGEGRVSCRDFEGAVRDATTAISMDPKLACAWASRAGAEAKLGRIDEAIGDYRRAIDLSPEGPRRASIVAQMERLIR